MQGILLIDGIRLNLDLKENECNSVRVRQDFIELPILVLHLYNKKR